MKMLLALLVLAGAILPMAGCETLADTPSENLVRVRHAMYMDLLQVPDDAERILYLDRPVWLTRLPVPND